MKITKRIVNTKRHTIGFVINNNKRVSRGEAAKLARRGKIEGVTAKKGLDGWYIASLPNSGNVLYNLPTVIR